MKNGTLDGMSYDTWLKDNKYRWFTQGTILSRYINDSTSFRHIKYSCQYAYNSPEDWDTTRLIHDLSQITFNDLPNHKLVKKLHAAKFVVYRLSRNKEVDTCLETIRKYAPHAIDHAYPRYKEEEGEAPNAYKPGAELILAALHERMWEYHEPYVFTGEELTISDYRILDTIQEAWSNRLAVAGPRVMDGL